MFEYILWGILQVSIGAFMTYVILKYATSDDVILRKIDMITSEMLTNDEFQKRIYALGALVGKGLVDGSGLKGKATGKRGLEGLVMEIIGNYIGSRITPQSSQQQEPLTQLGV